MNFDIGVKWKITHSMSVFGARSPLELIEKVSEYSMYNTACKIKCPTPLLAGEKTVPLRARLKDYMSYLNVQRNTFCLQKRKELKIIVMWGIVTC